MKAFIEKLALEDDALFHNARWSLGCGIGMLGCVGSYVYYREQAILTYGPDAFRVLHLNMPLLLVCAIILIFVYFFPRFIPHSLIAFACFTLYRAVGL